MLAICAYTEHISSIYIRETHFSSMVLGLRNVGGVKFQPFLKHSKHWKRALKMIFNESGCFQFPEAVVTSTAKESLCSTERGSIQVLAVLYNRKCSVESAVYFNKLL